MILIEYIKLYDKTKLNEENKLSMSVMNGQL